MTAVLAIINQLAGFVPARRAVLPLFDRIFTRIGAHDALSRGQSTFMVEMLETARILRHCGPGSLIILDEVGRGTSTYDGISIAKAVLEHLHEHAGRPLTLFATHFFELTDLAALLPRLANFQVEVARPGGADGGQLVFTYRVLPGAASDSFGIDVARQAGLPDTVVERARAVLAELEDARAAALAKARHAVQLALFYSGQH
jgi:DNA mismatch repair protein MutS